MKPTKLLTGMILLIVIFIAADLLLPKFVKPSAKPELPEVMPADFNFVLKYGVDAKNILDTKIFKFTKDMIAETPITTDLVLSDNEMKEIYDKMKTMDILDYEDAFMSFSMANQTLYNTYIFQFTYDGKDKTIYWHDKSSSTSEKAVRLRELFTTIISDIEGNYA